MLSLSLLHRKKAFQKIAFSIEEIQAIDRIVARSNENGGSWSLRDGDGTDVIDKIDIISATISLGLEIYKMCEAETLYALKAHGPLENSRDFAAILGRIERSLSDYNLIEREISADVEPESLAPQVGR